MPRKAPIVGIGGTAGKSALAVSGVMTDMNWGQAKKRGAGIVVLRRWPEGWRILILRAYRNWDFPKGLLEPGEGALAAALRETQEEAGLSDLVFRWGEVFVDTEPYAVGKVVRYFLAETPAGEVSLPISPELGRPEHSEFRWTTPDEAAALLPERLVRVLRWALARVERSG